MRHRNSLLRGFSRACLAALAIAGTVACSNQGEGDRCDTANGNDDCDTGLVCTRYSELGLQPASAAICCPESGATTVDACRGQSTFNPNADGGLSSGGAASGGAATTDAATDRAASPVEAGAGGSTGSGGAGTDAGAGGAP